jgi:hypothetical protein
MWTDLPAASRPTARAAFDWVSVPVRRLGDFVIGNPYGWPFGDTEW